MAFKVRVIGTGGSVCKRITPDGPARRLRPGAVIDWGRPREEIPKRWEVLEVIGEEDLASRLTDIEQPVDTSVQLPDPKGSVTREQLEAVSLVVGDFSKNDVEAWTNQDLPSVDAVRDAVGDLLKPKGSLTPDPAPWVTRKVISLATKRTRCDK